jgi:hypothetical protein
MAAGRYDDRVASTFERDDRTTSIPSTDAVEVLLRFGVLMLQAGNTAVRTRKWIDARFKPPRHAFSSLVRWQWDWSRRGFSAHDSVAISAWVTETIT